MKKIEVYIRPEKLEDIKAALNEFHINGLSITEIMGCGNQKGWKKYDRTMQTDYNFLPKIKLEIVARDEQVEDIIDQVCTKAMTGECGDGKIFVLDVAQAVRIRTRERGVDAIS
jgi:nitrogen regulatory protein P-II 1